MERSIFMLCKATLHKATYLPRVAVSRLLARREVASKIIRIDTRDIPNTNEIRAFMVIRNESLRLPFILKHYFAMGVDRIFVIDNDSSDETQSIVMAMKNTHVFYTKDRYANQGSWIDLLLRRYGKGRWCLVVDADEILIYPHFETVPLRQLCNFLEKESFNAMDCALLDMYPGGPLKDIKYERGTHPLLVASWFDRPSYTEGWGGSHYVNEFNLLHEGPPRLFGGMRKRVFDINPCLSKVPLIKFNNAIYLSLGTHWIQGAHVADVRGALLHFKFLDDFAANVQEEIVREQHWNNAVEYKRYATLLGQFPDLNFWYVESEQFSGSEQLLKLGIMKTTQAFNAYVGAMG